MIRVKDLWIRRGTFERVFKDIRSSALADIGEALNDAMVGFHEYHQQKMKELGLDKPCKSCDKWNPWRKRSLARKLVEFDKLMEDYLQQELVYPASWRPIPLSELDGFPISAVDVGLLRQLNVIAR